MLAADLLTGTGHDYRHGSHYEEYHAEHEENAPRKGDAGEEGVFLRVGTRLATSHACLSDARDGEQNQGEQWCEMPCHVPSQLDGIA